MKYILLVILVISLGFTATSQSKKRLLKNGNYYFEFNNFATALDYYQQYYDIDSTNSNVNFNIGLCLFFTAQDKQEAIPYLLKSDNVESLFYLAQISHLSEQCAEAIAYYQMYMNSDKPGQLSDSVIAYYLNKSYVAQRNLHTPRDVKMKRLSDSVNSPYPDYVPIISRDENTMYFTSRRIGSTGNNLDPLGNYYEDIYITRYENGEWTKAENIGEPINSPTHDACLGVSPDQSQMFIYRTNAETTGGGIYEVIKKDSVWSEPVWVDAEFNELDSKEKTICLIPSPDSTTYYFVSDKAGGFGGTDIYKIVRFSSGRWSLPENLGPEINTPYDEDSPFFHPDENTLYFSSKGHENMGDFDIFVSHYNTEQGTWDIPQNLGYPLNTVGGDRFLNVSVDGKRGYYSKAVMPGSSDIDIFVAEIPDSVINYIAVTGYLVDIESRQSVNAKIMLNEKGIPNIFGIYKPNLLTSRYVLIIRPGINYEITITAEGYKTNKMELFYPVDTRSSEISLDFEIEKIEVVEK